MHKAAHLCNHSCATFGERPGDQGASARVHASTTEPTCSHAPERDHSGHISQEGAQLRSDPAWTTFLPALTRLPRFGVGLDSRGQYTGNKQYSYMASGGLRPQSGSIAHAYIHAPKPKSRAWTREEMSKQQLCDPCFHGCSHADFLRRSSAKLAGGESSCQKRLKLLSILSILRCNIISGSRTGHHNAKVKSATSA